MRQQARVWHGWQIATVAQARPVGSVNADTCFDLQWEVAVVDPLDVNLDLQPAQTGLVPVIDQLGQQLAFVLLGVTGDLVAVVVFQRSRNLVQAVEAVGSVQVVPRNLAHTGHTLDRILGVTDDGLVQCDVTRHQHAVWELVLVCAVCPNDFVTLRSNTCEYCQVAVVRYDNGWFVQYEGQVLAGVVTFSQVLRHSRGTYTAERSLNQLFRTVVLAVVLWSTLVTILLVCRSDLLTALFRVAAFKDHNQISWSQVVLIQHVQQIVHCVFVAVACGVDRFFLVIMHDFEGFTVFTFTQACLNDRGHVSDHFHTIRPFSLASSISLHGTHKNRFAVMRSMGNSLPQS